MGTITIKKLIVMEMKERNGIGESDILKTHQFECTINLME